MPSSSRSASTGKVRYLRRLQLRRFKLPRWLITLFFVVVGLLFLAAVIGLFIYWPFESKGNEPALEEWAKKKASPLGACPAQLQSRANWCRLQDLNL